MSYPPSFPASWKSDHKGRLVGDQKNSLGNPTGVVKTPTEPSRPETNRKSQLRVRWFILSPPCLDPQKHMASENAKNCHVAHLCHIRRTKQTSFPASRKGVFSSSMPPVTQASLGDQWGLPKTRTWKDLSIGSGVAMRRENVSWAREANREKRPLRNRGARAEVSRPRDE